MQVIYSDEDRKFNKDIIIGLIRRELLNLAEYNNHLAKLLDAGKNSMCRLYCNSSASILTGKEKLTFFMISRGGNRVRNISHPNIGG